mmetsp:Transcript_4967/g.7703  ORF Transcript_4967/g.7703 Transcript_4967/m.7703 type:complete len:80 (-) Transcript_4967:166-405(-)
MLRPLLQVLLLQSPVRHRHASTRRPLHIFWGVLLRVLSVPMSSEARRQSIVGTVWLQIPKRTAKVVLFGFNQQQLRCFS